MKATCTYLLTLIPILVLGSDTSDGLTPVIHSWSGYIKNSFCAKENALACHPDKVLDSDFSTFWDAAPPSDAWIILEFPSPIRCETFALYSYGDTTHDVKDFELQYSTHPNASWTTLIQDRASAGSGWQYFDITATHYGYYVYWRLKLITQWSQWQAWLSEIQFEAVPRNLNYNYFYGYLCSDLTDRSTVTYDLAEYTCIQRCETSDSCVMINYFTHFKSNNDARCYTFDKLCQMSLDDTNTNRSVVAYKLQNRNCTDHPLDWKDNVGDSCSYYTSYDWCSDSAPSKPEQAFYDLVDPESGLSAMESCCGCGGGIYTMDNVVMSEDLDDALCAFAPSNDTNSSTVFRKWDNLILHQLCVDLAGKNKCEFLINAEFQSDDAYSISICTRREMDATQDSYEFIMELVHRNAKKDIYVNAMWFEIDNTYFAESIAVYLVDYAQCENILFNASQYAVDGIHPCHMVKDAVPPMDTGGTKVRPAWIVPTVISAGCICLVICVIACYKHLHSDKSQGENQVETEVCGLNTQPNAKGTEGYDREMETGFNDKSCIVCCEKRANMFNDPCGHITYCNKCATNAMQHDRRCPMCRSVMECKQIYM